MRSQTACAVAAVIALVAGGIALAAPAEAATPRSAPAAVAAVGVYNQLVNRHTNRCADVANKSVDFGALIHQWSCAHDLNQLWATEPVTGGIEQFRNLNSQLCMTAAMPYVNGSNIFQRACSTDLTSQWWQQENDGGFFKLRHLPSGKCLDLNNGSGSNGAKIQLWDCNTSSNAQHWYFS